MSKPEKAITVGIDAGSFDARNLMFFDRCGIYDIGKFRELHFGFYGDAQELQQGIIIVISKAALEESKANLLQYIDNLGTPDMTELPKLRIRGTGARVVPADIVGLAHTGTAGAEIIFHTFSSKVAVEKARAGSGEAQVTAICSALLRCEVDLQKRWVVGLYEGA